MTPDAADLELVFGPGTETTPEARARESGRLFVRSIDQLAVDDPQATGRRLSAREALEAYGFEKLLEVASEGSAALALTADAAGMPLHQRRLLLGLEPRVVAARAGVTEQEVLACEQSRRLPLQTYERVARALALDERAVAVSREPVGNDRLAVRLKTLGSDIGARGPLAVSALAEAAWVASTQLRIGEALGFRFERHGLEPSPNYGTSGFPAYEWGYRLAAQTRQALGIAPDEAIPSLRELVEDAFQIPLIQCELGDAIAGATLELGATGRAIVVNTSGRNRLFFIRRATLAHELGHLLFDPSPRLERLRVDEYDELDRSVEQEADPVEQRANAFAVEFIAPSRALVGCFDRTGSLARTVAEYGLGPTATRHQVRNASRGRITAENQRLPAQGAEDWRQLFSDWEGRENFAVDYPPIPTLRPSRAGRFCALAVRAAEEGIVSWDTAAEWLETDVPTVRNSTDLIRELFPRVWSQT